MLMNVFFDGYEWLLHGYYIVVTWSSMVITNVMTMSWSDSDPLAILENFTYSELWPGGGQCNWLHARSLLAVFTGNHQFCLLSSSTGHNKTITNLDILCIYIYIHMYTYNIYICCCLLLKNWVISSDLRSGTTGKHPTNCQGWDDALVSSLPWCIPGQMDRLYLKGGTLWPFGQLT